MGNMSLQFVNSTICTLRLGLDLEGGLVVAWFLVCMVLVGHSIYIVGDNMYKGKAMMVWCF